MPNFLTTASSEKVPFGPKQEIFSLCSTALQAEINCVNIKTSDLLLNGPSLPLIILLSM